MSKYETVSKWNKSQLDAELLQLQEEGVEVPELKTNAEKAAFLESIDTDDLEETESVEVSEETSTEEPETLQEEGVEVPETSPAEDGAPKSQFYRGSAIISVDNRIQNGRLYKEFFTADGCGYVLTPEDFENEVTEK